MDEKLTKKEKQLCNDFKNNYIANFATLVADNIASIYYRFGNGYHTSLSTTIKESKDTYPLTNSESNLLDELITNILKEKHQLEIVDKINLFLKKSD